MATLVWAAVPVKSLAAAKQRLSPLLDGAERQALFRAMLEDVLAALTRVDELAGVLVVTADAEVQRLARGYGGHVLRERTNRGHTKAAALAARTLAAQGADTMLQLPGDLPLLSGTDIRALLVTHAAGAPAVTIAPSRDEKGSNAVTCSPPDVLPLRFGNDSFYPHIAKARELGIEPRVVRRHALGLDVDTPRDLRAFARTPSATRAYAYLRAAGIVERLAR